MSSVPQVPLVDIDGRPITGDLDASQWPAWTDNFYWEVEPNEVVALEVAEVERIQDILDALDRRQVSPVELSMLAAGMAI
jgi:hypothetical protein